ncbi:MAG TPA: ribonuclease Z [Gemmatimonadaceae bacterium]|nr:ribonuclease Z [Gemmatimonadaceae bacterium]
MSLSLKFLGTSAARPTVERNVSSLALVREGETLLIDCGEGTQRQMMKYGITFALDDIFFTHFHGDHIIGAIGLFRTLALQGRTELMRLWGPKGAKRALGDAVRFGNERIPFPVEITEVEPGQPVARKGYAIVPFAADHGGAPSVGYAMVEEARKGEFHPDVARALNVPEGPLWGALHRGETITLESGRRVEPREIVGPPRPGRTVVITGDTKPSEATVEIARGADLLVHEATFAEEEAARAAETGHATARQAAEIAARAGVRQLVLTHLSARYSADPGLLAREAKAVFENVAVARDGMEIEVPFATESSA